MYIYKSIELFLAFLLFTITALWYSTHKQPTLKAHLL